MLTVACSRNNINYIIFFNNLLHKGRRVKESFVKLNLRWPYQRNKNDLPLLKEVLSKGGFVKPAPDIKFPIN